jgi:predicted methyltransferase
MARPQLTRIAQLAWERFLPPGSWAVDATAGNGLDTEFLARTVGPEGRVFAFDIQDNALRATSARLEAASLLERVTLIRADHARMRAHLPCSSTARIRLICFNLGYLPTGDHAVTTRPESTIPALHEALLLLAPEGGLSVMVYRGHEGGMEEAEAVEGFMRSLPSPWSCLQHESTGSAGRPGPVWWLAGAAD